MTKRVVTILVKESVDSPFWGRRDHPWQTRMAGIPLVLHGPLDLAVDTAALRADFIQLDATLPADHRHYRAEDDGWSVISLIEQGGSDADGVPQPALALMPSLAHMLAPTDWRVQSAHLMRLPPRGVLPWHFEPQAPHLPQCRVLIPLQVPPGAMTLIGDGAVAYPEGTAWAGDFTFPHQVENRSNQQRVVLIFDLVTTSNLLRMMPPALTEDFSLRIDLAHRMSNILLHERQQSTPLPL